MPVPNNPMNEEQMLTRRRLLKEVFPSDTAEEFLVEQCTNTLWWDKLLSRRKKFRKFTKKGYPIFRLPNENIPVEPKEETNEQSNN